MTQEWVVLNGKWRLRPTQDGLELATPERNIALELSDPEEHRSWVASILSGRRRIPQGSGNEAIRQTIHDLEAQDILRCQEYAPIHARSASKIERLVWELRSAFLGTRGPINTVYHMDPSQSKFHPLSSRFVTAKYTPYGETGEEWAGGTDDNPLLAELKAIMEALERWASGVVPEQEFFNCSMQTLGTKAIDPRTVIAYKQWQYRQKNFPFTPFSPEREYLWKEVMAFSGENKRFLPVECLYYPIARKLAPTPYTFANSSGVASAFSFEGALIGGIYEAIERDAFMLAWLNRLSPPRIQTTTLPQKEQERIGRFQELGYEIHLINLTRDLAPVVLAIAVHHTKRPALVLGAASNFNFLTATSKAIGEVEHQLHWELRNQEHTRVITNERKVEGVMGHMALYASQRYLAKAEFLWEGPEIPCPDSPPIGKKHELEKLLQSLGSSGKQLMVADLTPSSLKEHGVWVVRAIPLGLVPISFGYGMEPLGMPRIHEAVSEASGWKGKPFTHPFA